MRGCLFTLLLGVVVVGVLLVIGLPAVAAGVLTAGLAAAGLQADDTTVTVSSEPPTDLLRLHADTVRVTASDATFRGLEIGSLDLALGDVSVLERTAGSVDGELREVTVRGAGGQRVTLDRITVLGTTDAVTTTALVPAAEAEALIADAVEAQLGERPSRVDLASSDQVRVTVRGQTLTGRFDVTSAGNLVVVGDDALTGGRQVTLVRGGEDVPIELTSVRVTKDGSLRLTGELAVGLLG